MDRRKVALALLTGASLACAEPELFLVPPPGTSGSYVLFLAAEPPVVAAAEGGEPLVLTGAAPGSEVEALVYEAGLLALGLSRGALEPAPGRCCSLARPQSTFRLDWVGDRSGAWISAEAPSAPALDQLLPDRHPRCQDSCAPLVRTDLPLGTTARVVVAQGLGPERAVLARDDGWVGIFDSGRIDEAPLCTLSGTRLTAGALRGTDALYLAAFDRISTLNLSEQSGGPCRVTTVTTAPARISVVRLAVSNPDEPLELVAMGEARETLRWDGARWARGPDAPPSSNPVVRERAVARVGTGRYLLSGGGVDYLRLDKGVWSMSRLSPLNEVFSFGLHPEEGALLGAKPAGLFREDGSPLPLRGATEEGITAIVAAGPVLFLASAGNSLLRYDLTGARACEFGESDSLQHPGFARRLVPLAEGAVLVADPANEVDIGESWISVMRGEARCGP